MSAIQMVLTICKADISKVGVYMNLLFGCLLFKSPYCTLFCSFNSRVIILLTFCFKSESSTSAKKTQCFQIRTNLVF